MLVLTSQVNFRKHYLANLVCQVSKKSFPAQSRSDFLPDKGQNPLGIQHLEARLRAIDFLPYYQTEISAKSFLLGVHVYPHRVRSVLYNSSCKIEIQFLMLRVG